jgi:ABC-type transport system substrate-binding protein
MELELDPKKKYDLSVKLWDFLNEEMPAIPLSTSALSDHYWQKSVKGIMPDGATFKGMYVAHRWDTVWLDR